MLRRASEDQRAKYRGRKEVQDLVAHAESCLVGTVDVRLWVAGRLSCRQSQDDQIEDGMAA